MIDKIAAQLHKETGYPEDALKYSLTILWNTIFGYGVLIITGYLFNWLDIAFAIAITYSLFRMVSGGAHASSNLRCVIAGTLIFNFLSYLVLVLHSSLPININYLLLVTSGLVAVAFYLYAPADVTEKPIDTYKQKRNLKLLSFLFLGVWILFMGTLVDKLPQQVILASAIGLLWQSASISPIGYKMINLVDSFLEKILRR